MARKSVREESNSRRCISLDALKYEPPIAPRLQYQANADLAERIRAALATLSPEEELIVRSRFEFEFQRESFFALGRKLGLTGEAVRKRLNRALEKLKPRLCDFWSKA
jgi:DNA-directed RNA polymerase sigma subunit (sigma70/sigma32)